MEGVGARLGRSSTRYGPATVFTGPVRKWKKTWVHVSSSNSNSNAAAAAAANGNNSAHLLLYKWTPISQNANNNSNSNKDDDAAAAATTTEEEPPRRKFRYVPVAVLEEQRNEASARDDDEVNGDSLVADASQTTLKGDRNVDRKPDVNDVPMEEVQGRTEGYWKANFAAIVVSEMAQKNRTACTRIRNGLVDAQKGYFMRPSSCINPDRSSACLEACLGTL